MFIVRSSKNAAARFAPSVQNRLYDDDDDDKDDRKRYNKDNRKRTSSSESDRQRRGRRGVGRVRCWFRYRTMLYILIVCSSLMYALLRDSLRTEQRFDLPVQRLEDAGFVAYATINDLFLTSGWSIWTNERKRAWVKHDWYAAELVKYCSNPPRLPLIMIVRMMKTGSTTLLHLVSRLSGTNRYGMDYRRIKADNESAIRVRNEMARYFYSFRHRTVHAAHGAYVDFGEAGYPRPAYVTLLRDPILRTISHYNYKQFGERNVWVQWTRGTTSSGESTSSSFDECVRAYARRGVVGDCIKLMHVQLRFLCGHRPECYVDVPDERVLRIAKTNIERDFVVVGITERMRASLRLIERMLPSYFSDLERTYVRTDDRNVRVNVASSESHGPTYDEDDDDDVALRFDDALRLAHAHIPIDVLTVLKRELALDLQLYEYAWNRFNRQISSCSKKTRFV